MAVHSIIIEKHFKDGATTPAEAVAWTVETDTHSIVFTDTDRLISYLSEQIRMLHNIR